MTEQDYGAVIVLSQGKIVETFYRTIRGMPAVPFMREITTSRYFFKSNPYVANETSANRGSLPENNEIFKALGMSYGEDVSSQNEVGKRILIVEDSALARKSILNVLTGKGYHLIETKDGLEALIRLGEEKPDLVLLDLILPKMDGYAVLSTMKKDDNYKNIPVIVLTSRNTLFDKLKGKMSGTDEYLTKPIQPDELLEKLDKYLH